MIIPFIDVPVTKLAAAEGEERRIVVAAKYGFSVLKMRRILVSAGAYKNVKSIQIQKLYYEGRTFDEIVKLSGLKRASVISYLPYEKIIYNLPERSPGAIRALRHRRRKRIKKEGRNIKQPTCPMMWIYEYEFQHKGFHSKEFFKTREPLC